MPASQPAVEPLEEERRPRTSRLWVWSLVAVVIVAGVLGVGYGFLGWFAPPTGTSPVDTTPAPNPPTPPPSPPPSPPAENQPPVALIQSSDLSPATYDTVAFNASDSSDPDGDALTYHWDLPNGSASNRVSVNYTFDSVGTFPFKLTVTDTHGAQDVAQVNVTVHPAPLTAGTNVPYPPFEMYNASAGKFEGFDIELAEAAAAEAGYAITWVNYDDFAVLLQSVAAGTVDMAAAAITSSGAVGAQRNLTMAFSLPYFWVDYGVLVGTSSDLRCLAPVCTPTELANRTVGVLGGSMPAAWVEENLVAANRTPRSMVYTYALLTSMIAALQGGSVSMLLLESFITDPLASGSGGSLKVAGVVSPGDAYSFAFPRTAEGLLTASRIDGGLEAVVQSGAYAVLYAKWFGV